MRYKHILLVCFFIATATWLWAEPSPEVIVPQPKAYFQVAQAAPDEPSNPPVERWTREVLVPAKEVAIASPQPELELSATRGNDLESSVFELRFTCPEPYVSGFEGEPGVEEGTMPPVNVMLSDGTDGFFDSQKASRIGPNHWKVSGRDIVWNTGDQKMPAQVSEVSEAMSLRASTYVFSSRQARYSRGARMVRVDSAAVRVARRAGGNTASLRVVRKG